MDTFPAGQKSYGSTIELFFRIKGNIAAQANLSDETSALLTFRVFSTWFGEVLSLAPCLLITGWAHEGGSILRAVRTFCYHPLLMAGITAANLNMVPWHLRPTLLISEPHLSKRMALLLDCSTLPGYQALRRGEPRDYFGSKAIYLGVDPPTKSMTHGVHVNASDTAGTESKRASILSDEMVQEFQDQLLLSRDKSSASVQIRFQCVGIVSGVQCNCKCSWSLYRGCTGTPGGACFTPSASSPAADSRTLRRLGVAGCPCRTFSLSQRKGCDSCWRDSL